MAQSIYERHWDRFTPLEKRVIWLCLTHRMLNIAASEEIGCHPSSVTEALDRIEAKRRAFVLEEMEQNTRR